MADRAYVDLFRWALPRVGLRWEGFRNVRGQVEKRIAARIRALGVGDVASYRARLETDPAELGAFEALCRVIISRFWRDRAVFDALRERLLPPLVDAAARRGDVVFRVWSAGCASGEEPFSFSMLWHLELAPRAPALAIDLLATDVDEEVLARAARGEYRASSLRELPRAWRDAAFDERDGLLVIRDRFREGVRFVREDVRAASDAGPFSVVLCRNVAFTYFDEATQRAFATRVAERLAPGGLLVVGGHESIPRDVPSLVRTDESPHIFRRVSAPQDDRRSPA